MTAAAPWLAAVSALAFVVVVFPVRAWIQGRHGTRPQAARWRVRRPPRWLLADAAFIGGLGALPVGALLEGLGVIDPVVRPTLPQVAVGGGLIGLAFGLILWAQGSMGAAWRPDIAPTDDVGLVTHGPFSLVRNPSYVAMDLLGLGVVALAPDVVTLVGCLALLMSLALTARLEEPALLARHGAAYASYGARVGRFLPGVGRIRPRPRPSG